MRAIASLPKLPSAVAGGFRAVPKGAAVSKGRSEGSDQEPSDRSCQIRCRNCGGRKVGRGHWKRNGSATDSDINVLSQSDDHDGPDEWVRSQPKDLVVSMSECSPRGEVSAPPR